MRVSDFPKGPITLIFPEKVFDSKRTSSWKGTRKNIETRTLTGEIIESGGKKHFIYKERKNRKISFGPGTLAMDEDGVVFKSLILGNKDNNEEQIKELENIKKEIENHGAIARIVIIPRIGYEFVFNRKMILAVAELINMLERKLKNTGVSMDLVSDPLRFKKYSYL